MFVVVVCCARRYETASADATTSATIGHVEVTVDPAELAQLLSEFSALQLNVLQPQETPENGVKDNSQAANNGGDRQSPPAQSSKQQEIPASSSSSSSSSSLDGDSRSQRIGLDHWIHRHRLRNVAVHVHSITACLALKVDSPDGGKGFDPKAHSSLKAADNRQLVARVTGVQGTLFQEASYAHISVALQGVCAELRTEVSSGDDANGDASTGSVAAAHVFPLLRFGGCYTADPPLVAASAFHQSVPAVTATISNSTLTADGGAAVPDIAHLPPSLQRAFYAAFSRQVS